MADVRSLQSQLHSVDGRSASGDRIILPLSSMSEVLGIKTVLLSPKCSGTVLLPTETCKRQRGSVFRESSRIVCFLAFSRIALNSASAPNGSAEYRWSSRSRFRTEDRMFGHATWNAFALLLPISSLMDDKMYRRVVTRNGPVPQILEDVGVAVKVSRLSHR